jgi:hypothetical protein
LRARLVAVIAGIAVACGIAAAVIVGTGFQTEVTAYRGPLPDVWNTAEVDPSVPAWPALPTAETLPVSFTPAEREAALLWIDHLEYETQCMVDAGFPSFRVGALWQPGLPEYPAIAWQEGLSDAEKARSATTWFGDPGSGIGNGVGADYHWELGGCNGYGWHMAGVDHPY